MQYNNHFFLKGVIVSDAEEEGHSSAIKTPKQVVTVLVAAFVFPIAIIVLLAKLATGNVSIDENNPAFSDKAIAKRLKTEGTLVIASDLPQMEKKMSNPPGQATKFATSFHARCLIWAPCPNHAASRRWSWLRARRW